jgi:hypothetical protein
MMVANMLRNWLLDVPNLMLEIDEWDQADEPTRGAMPISALPPFAFEETLELVTRLGSRGAREIFDLLYIKSNANDGITSAIRYASEDDAAEEVRGRIAQIFLVALPIYKVLAGDIGWSTPKYLEVQAEEMRQARERWQGSSVHREAATSHLDEVVAPTLE